MRYQKAPAHLRSSLSTGLSLSRVAGLLVNVDQNVAVARGEEGRGLAQDELDRGALVRVGDHERTLAHLLAHDRERLQQRLVEAGGVNKGHISIRPRAGRRIGVRKLELYRVARGSSQSRPRESARARASSRRCTSGIVASSYAGLPLSSSGFAIDSYRG